VDNILWTITLKQATHYLDSLQLTFGKKINIKSGKTKSTTGSIGFDSRLTLEQGHLIAINFIWAGSNFCLLTFTFISLISSCYGQSEQ